MIQNDLSNRKLRWIITLEFKVYSDGSNPALNPIMNRDSAIKEMDLSTWASNSNPTIRSFEVWASSRRWSR